MPELEQLTADLLAEQELLDRLVSPLTDEQWATPSPSPGWSVADQIAHLAYFDGAAVQAIEDPDGFRAAASVLRASDDVDSLTLQRDLGYAERFGIWRENRGRLETAAGGLDTSARVPWYGPSMSAMSFLTARLMECWAHGQDVFDALGEAHPVTDRLRHVARIGFLTRSWSYVNRGLEAPDVPVRVELTGPGGDLWVFGAEDAAESIRGPAEDFCLVTTQRRHVDDTKLAVTGASARDWMEKAQAFAGRPTDGPGIGGRR